LDAAFEDAAAARRVGWRLVWIRGVEIPGKLVQAHREGRLVLFVGAGASVDPPSSLPTFGQLAAEIVEQSRVDPLKLSAALDVRLGELDEWFSVDVHARVAQRIGDPASQPNGLHRAIAALAVSGSPVRIVTTNYDTHLSTALKDLEAGVEEFRAPALPVGDNFAGLVYLHGRLGGDPRSLVVTDADFGRSYLRDAWATRFLERMFSHFTVLFVGYSHDDVVMSYLARGLGRNKDRFALFHEPDAPQWRRLRITPIAYSVRDGSHAALSGAIEGWAAQAAMGLLDHRQRIAELLAAAPSPVPEDESYLQEVIGNPDRVGLFTQHARGADWLSWARRQPEFLRVFDPTAQVSDCTGLLAWWFAERYVMDEDLTQAALAAVNEAGGELGTSLWLAVAQCLHSGPQPRPPWLGPWVVLLIENAPEQSAELLDYALVASRWPEDRETALLLFDHLSEPKAVLTSWMVADAQTRFDIRLRGSPYWLEHAWKNTLGPRLDEVARDVLVIADRHLRRAYRLQAAAGSVTGNWDPLSYRRSAIEPHRQDGVRSPLDVLLDAARDCCETLLDRRDEIAIAQLIAWGESPFLLLRRLAVHGWTHRSDIDVTAKLRHALEKGWPLDPQLRHESFVLIARTLPDAALDVADALVRAVVERPEGPELRDYEVFNLLSWIARHAPHLVSAREALAQIHTLHPEFEEPDHPDLTAWSPDIGTIVEPQPPMTLDDLHGQIGDSTSDAIAGLDTYRGTRFPFNGPTWAGTLALLSDVVQRWPCDGFSILEVVSRDDDFVVSVVNGWARAVVDDETGAAILERLRDVDLTATGRAVAELLDAAQQGEPGSTRTEWHRLPAARRLAEDVWTATPTGLSPSEAENWLSWAINRTAGRLAQFWLHALAAEWRAAGDSWLGIPEPWREELEGLLAGSDDRTSAAEVVLASQVQFFHAADRAWCERAILPLLDWSDAARARRTWDGFVMWGRWNDDLLRVGLLNHLQAAAEHLDEFDEGTQRHLLDQLATVALRSELNVLGDDGWLHSFTRSVDADARVEWMHHVGWQLAQLPPEAVEHQWRRWMRAYWTARLDSIPLDLCREEASVMATWVPYLGVAVAEGVDLALRRPAALPPHSGLLGDLTDERIARAPTEFASLVAHLLRGTDSPFYDCHHLAEVVPRLRTHGVGVAPILEQALRLNCTSASTW
jgi:hypothetical protein